MSGPKVVRIVTREEMQATGRELLRQFEAEAQRLRRVAYRNDIGIEDLTRGLDEKHRMLNAMYDQDRWTDLQKQAALELNFLRAEHDQVVTRATSLAMDRNRRLRSLVDGAKSLIAALQAEGQPVPAALSKIPIEAISAGAQALETMQLGISAGLDVLRNSASKSEGVKDEQRALAARLAAGEKRQTLDQWLAAQPAPLSQTSRIDRLLAEIEVLGGDESAKGFLERAANIHAEKSEQRRHLLTDSLTLELVDFLSESKRREQARQELFVLKEALESAAGSNSNDLLSSIDAALRQDLRLEWPDLAKRAATEIAEAKRHAASLARRRALLGGLSSLGYEVRESMVTTWATKGRVVARKPGATDYGIELGASADADKIQVRVVAATKPTEVRTPRRDLDAETTWCSEFSKLKNVLRATGADFIIEQALPVGAQPLKAIEMGNSADERNDEGSQTIQGKVL